MKCLLVSKEEIGWKAKIYSKCKGCHLEDSFTCFKNCPNLNEFLIRNRRSTGIPLTLIK